MSKSFEVLNKRYLAKISRVLVAIFVGALIYPISGVVSTAVLPAASAATIITKPYTWAFSDSTTAGSTAPTGWTDAGAADMDDLGYTVLNTTWSVKYNGTSYNRVDVSSNSYITFWNSTASRPNTAAFPTRANGATTPAAATIHLCSADRKAYRIYYKVGTDANGKGILQIRWEGYSFYSTGYTSGIPQTIWEATLYQDSSIVDLGFGINGGCLDTNRPSVSGLSDGTAFFKYFSSAISDTLGGNPSIGYRIDSANLAVNSSGGTTISTNVGMTIYDTITTSGGAGTTTITMDTPTTGASFDSTTGVFRLNRLDSATVTQTFTAKDSNNATSTLTVTFIVNALPTNTQSRSILTTTLGRAWQETMTVAGGTAPFTFVKTSSNAQTGITIDTSTTRAAVLKVAATGVVAGTTTETITCTDAVGSVTVAVFTVVINPALSLTNPKGYNVPATKGTPIAETITASGGSLPASFVLSGTLTSGNIYLDTSSAASGYVVLKTLAALAIGTYYETVTATDTRSVTATLGLKISVVDSATIAGGATSSTVMAAGTVTYDTVTVTGGSLPLSYSLTVSPANSGISIFSSSNTQIVFKYLDTVVSGTYTLTITATDTASAVVTHVRTLVASSSIRWDTSTATTMSATFGTAGSSVVRVTNGFSGKSFTLTQVSGSSTGITLDTTTASSGYATLKTSATVPVGTYIESITATDVTGVKISILVTINVVAPPVIKSGSTLLAGNFGSLQYDGNTQYSSLATGSEMVLGTTYTIEWWQYQTDTHVYPRVFEGGSIARGLAVSLEGYNGVAGDNFFFWTAGNSHNLGTASTSRKNTWMHYAVVVTNNRAIAYENGKALNSTAVTVETITSTVFPSSSQICLAAQCSVSDTTTTFAGNITNFLISTRADYSGLDTSNQNFIPTTSMKLDSSTVIALAPVSGDSKFVDFSSYSRSGTNTGSPVASTKYPTQLLTISATQGSAYTTPLYVATNGTGDKTFGFTNGNSGISISANPNQASITLANTLTSLTATTARTLYDTMTATDSLTSAVKLPFKFLINPPISLTATSSTPQTSVGVALYDTITATYGTGNKTFSVISSEINSGITFSSPSQNTYVVKADATVPQGTYYETVTATDGAGATSTLLITLTVSPPMSLVSATGSSSLITTAGKAASLRLNSSDGVAPKTYTLTHIGTARTGITLDTSTAPAYATLNIGNGVPSGSYSESVTVRDSTGASVSLLISVTVNDTPTISYGGTTSGAITLTTTAGAALTSGVFTAALGTGSRTLSLSGLNSGITIDTATANTAYVTAGTSLTSTNNTTAKSYYETITVTDSLTATAIRAFTVVVNPVISLTASSTSFTTTSGVVLTDTITATQGTGNKTFKVTSSPSISGITNTTNVANQTMLTIPTSLSPDTYTITISATDSVGATSSISVTLVVNGGLVISGSSAITTTNGYTYTSTGYSASNGTGTKTFSLSVSPANSGISLSATTGTPSIIVASTVAAATYTVTLRVTDSSTASATFAVTVTVNPPVTITGALSVTKTYGNPSTYVFNTSGGTAPFTFSTTNICTTEVSTSGGITTEKIMGVASCDWQVPAGVSTLSGVLVVGGGGGGGWGSLAGGGGAGEVESSTAAISVTAGAKLAVSVGAGGEDGYVNDGTSNNWKCGANGSNSTFVVNGVTITALGGGGGAGNSLSPCTNNGGNGGSGGGANTSGSAGTSSKVSQTGWTAYGNDGGGATGGGGGAGGAGNAWSAADGSKGKGGAPITLMDMTFAGGGGAWNGGSSTNGNETGGGGGAGRARGTQSGWAFACNSCDATSGSGSGGGAGGRGGSGFIAIQYATPSVSASTTALTFNTIAKTPTGQLQLNVPENVQAGTYTSTVTVFQDTVSDNNLVSNAYSLTINVNKATPSVTLGIPGGGNSATYGSPVSLTATAPTAGNFNFKNGGATIAGCGTKVTTSGVATCIWTPTDTSTVTMTALFTPTDSTNYETATTPSFTLTVLQADTLTVTFNNQTLTYSESGTAVSRAFTLTGLTSIDTVTAVATAITGTANDLTAVNVTGSATTGAPGTSTVTKAGTFSLSGTGITFSGTTKASYYKAITYVPGTVTVNKAGNSISLNYGTANTITYKPTGTETATVTFKGTGTKSFSTTTTTYCSVDPATGALTTSRAGSCDVAVAIGEGPNFLGDTITATVTINRATRTIGLTSSSSSLKYGDTATVTTTVSYAANDGAITYSAGSSTGCTFDNTANVITATSGTTNCALIAKIATGTNYESATSTSLNITLSKANAPVLTLTPPSAINYSPTATSATMPLPTFSITGLKLSDTLTAASDITINYVATGTYPYNSTTVPTNANTYSLTPTAITLSSGSMSNYNTPTFSSVSWTINQITQDTLTVKSLFQEGITVPYDIQYGGGSTLGTVTGLIVNGGTASSCSFAGINLRANGTGTCFIRLKMAGNQNYLDVYSDTYTVLIANFKQYVFNFDSLAQGPGGITITSQVPVKKGADVCTSNCQPKITSVSTTSVFIGDPIVLTGSNFATATEVIFNLDSSVYTFQIDNGGTTITVIVPADVSPGSGGINVRSPQGLSPMFMGITFKASNVVG